MSRDAGFRRFPVLPIADHADDIRVGWEQVRDMLRDAAAAGPLAVECYQGVDCDRIIAELAEAGTQRPVVDTRAWMKPAAEIEGMVAPDLTDDPVFGRLTRLDLEDFLLPVEQRVAVPPGSVVVGPGATLLAGDATAVVYADMPRWEIQHRQRAGLVASLGARNRDAGAKALYKRSYFVDWRVLDRHKRRVLPRATMYLESVSPDTPRLLPMWLLEHALDRAAAGPLELVPFFDPGVWGGQWMRERFGLDPEAPNYAWCFNCVPEENSILLGFGAETVEVPAINLVFFRARLLLGEPVHARFGAEFPIPFDFLDTMGGQNLSLQVHPLTGYIREHFGLPYTQDESYYILDAGADARVYLGLKDGIDPARMRAELQTAQSGGPAFPAENYVQTWPVQAHDHVLIPAGTVHCSGRDTMVLEVSATPYIFTFKLWDWERLDLDGKPRPINIERAWPNIQWNRTTSWTRRELVNRVEQTAAGEGWREERTGLHELEFIETRRHWFSVPVDHDTGGAERGSVHVLNLVHGTEAVIESHDGRFPPFPLHYAETVVVPAAVGRYRVRPSGPSEGQTVATLRASVRLGLDP